MMSARHCGLHGHALGLWVYLKKHGCQVGWVLLGGQHLLGRVVELPAALAFGQPLLRCIRPCTRLMCVEERWFQDRVCLLRVSYS